MEKNQKKIVMVDDHPMVLEGIRACLEEYEDLAVVSAVSSAEELLNSWDPSGCDVVLMDMNLPGLSGFEATSKLIEQSPRAKVLIFSMLESGEYARRAVNAGAKGYVLKDAMPDELVLALRTVVQGGTYFSEQITQALARAEENMLKTDLTLRELDVLKQLAEGKSSKQIAGLFDISVRTVESHRGNLKAKLGGQSAAECVQIAINAELI